MHRPKKIKDIGQAQPLPPEDLSGRQRLFHASYFFRITHRMPKKRQAGRKKNMTGYDEYKKRHRERRRKELQLMRPPGLPPVRDYGSPYDRYSPPTDKGINRHPSVRLARRFVIQCLVSALLFSAVYWINLNKNAHLQPIRESIVTAMTHEFQFAAVSGWYEKNLGAPVSFLPGFFSSNKGNQAASGSSSKNKSSAFAEPVIGQVQNRFNSRTNGITVATSPNSAVEAAKDGLVVFVGQKSKIGRTVIIQHQNSDESWYGKLNNVNVKVYEFVKQGQKIGTTGGSKQGMFYFALKKGQKFIDPIQVMSFD